jgi:hypothetical protein
MFYYTKGMISRSREAFKNIYENDAKGFKRKLYEIYEKDKRKKTGQRNGRGTGCLFASPVAVPQ